MYWIDWIWDVVWPVSATQHCSIRMVVRFWQFCRLHFCSRSFPLTMQNSVANRCCIHHRRSNWSSYVKFRCNSLFFHLSWKQFKSLHGEHHNKTPDTDFTKPKYQNTARPVTLIDLNCFYHFPWIETTWIDSVWHSLDSDVEGRNVRAGELRKHSQEILEWNHWNRWGRKESNVKVLKLPSWTSVRLESLMEFGWHVNIILPNAMSDVTRCHKSVIWCVITMALWMLGEDCREQLCSAKVRRQTAQRRVGLGRSSPSDACIRSK